MPDLYRALSVSVEEDLLPLSALLHRHGLPHRISEVAGRQVLEVETEEQAQQVQDLYRRWRSGEFEIQISRAPRRSEAPLRSSVLGKAPVTLALIALSVCGFLLVYFIGSVEVIGYLTFTPVDVRGDQLVFKSMGGQYWRLVTPIFLHFGWLHIVFNCLWLWELGHRVEAVMGRFNMLMLCLAIALVSNGSQYVYGGPGLFGGMSGVVYGLLGFAWVAPLLQPRWPIQPMPAIMLFMVGWLVACMVGVVEALGFGAIANAAHLGGLLSGAVLGALFGALSRSARDNT
ncbi:MAG: rhomboid family intramembrane serine protease [Halioglobus sp.]|nr:rhomboid family intramembrane serine protease [Halioglobus sp.]